MITHVVLLALNDPADRDEAVARLSALPQSIPEIATLQVGVDTEATDGASDIVLITTHDDSSSLKAYQSHTVHQEFLSWLRPKLASRAVVDTNSLNSI
ncbi:MAG: Dabb family protein [Candidatus Nanopelagicales bacterium]